jgi:hypothetical protein
VDAIRARGIPTLAAVMAFVAGPLGAQSVGDWPVHAPDRPQPPVVDPGRGALPVPPPRDAVVLFDGRDLAKWAHATGSDAKWVVRDGYFEVVRGSGDLQTRDGFGDVQLHVEWMSPVAVRGEGQDRGNSGVYLMNTYEVQVLDSYDNRTYPDGQAAALYGQYPPLVNASRPPGEWQSYDIVFHRPRFGPNGELLRPATITVLHNGVLVQDNVALTGPTAHHARPPYVAHADRLPIKLQDHGHAVRFRNIWLRELGAR